MTEQQDNPQSEQPEATDMNARLRAHLSTTGEEWAARLFGVDATPDTNEHDDDDEQTLDTGGSAA